jgi:hypothetical protein
MKTKRSIIIGNCTRITNYGTSMQGSNFSVKGALLEKNAKEHFLIENTEGKFVLEHKEVGRAPRVGTKATVLDAAVNF